MAVCLGTISEGGSLSGGLSYRFLDLGSSPWSSLSSPLTAIEKFPWAELGEAQSQGRQEFAIAEVGEKMGLRLRGYSETRGYWVWRTKCWGTVNSLVR